MFGSKKQVTGFKYYKSFARVLGNAIEGIWAVKFDDKDWVFAPEDGPVSGRFPISKPSMFGENDGVSGVIYIHLGTPNQMPDAEYKAHDPLISGFPYQSMLVFRGSRIGEGFYVGNNSMMKETMIWAKRIHVKNDGSPQWFDETAEIDGGDVDNCKILIPWISPIKWQLNSTNQLDNYEWSILRLDFDDDKPKSGQLTYEFSIETGLAVSFSSNQILVTKGGSLSITSTHEISVTEKTRNDNYWGKEYSYTVTIPPPEYNEDVRQHVVVYFNYDLSSAGGEGDSLYLDMGNRPTPTAGKVCRLPDINHDINPIHKIREILTDYNALNKPEDEIDEASFVKSALKIYQERLGISWCIRDKDCLEAINELCYHIEAGCRVNRQTGLYEMVLFRDDWFTDDEIHEMPEGEIKSMKPELTDAKDLINKLNIKFYNRAETKDGATSISDVGLVKTMGRIATEDADFPYFQNKRNSIVSGNWKLKKLSTPRWSGTFTTGRKDARKWNRYDLIKLTWSRRWKGEILVRITSINIGTATNSEVTIKFEEVVKYSDMTREIISGDKPNPPPSQPLDAIYSVFEMPYYPLVMAYGQRMIDDELAFNNDYGFIGAVAGKPQPNSIYAVLQTIELEQVQRLVDVFYSAFAVTTEQMDRVQKSFTTSGIKDTQNIDEDSPLILLGNEWMCFNGVNESTGEIFVKRGLLDTHPMIHSNGSNVFICGNNDIACPEREFVAGDKFPFEVLTTTPSGVQEPTSSNEILFQSRAFRPYPPQNVRVNDEYWSEAFDGDLTIEWSHRNRNTQVLTNNHTDWYDGSVDLEHGVTYVLTLNQYNSNGGLVAYSQENIGTVDTYTLLESELESSAVKIIFELKTIRGEYECLYPFSQELVSNNYFSAPYDITYTVS